MQMDDDLFASVLPSRTSPIFVFESFLLRKPLPEEDMKGLK